MSNKALTIALVILIIAGAAYYFATHSSAVPQTTVYQNATSTSEASQGSLQGSLTGKWQSTDDAKFVRTFTATTVTDTYEGDASTTETGNYSIVNPAQESNFPVSAEAVAGMSVIRVDFPKTGTMYFSIQALSSTTLAMTYLSGRGNILSFTRVQ